MHVCCGYEALGLSAVRVKSFMILLAGVLVAWSGREAQVNITTTFSQLTGSVAGSVAARIDSIGGQAGL